MKYRVKERKESDILLAEKLAPVVTGLGLSLVEFSAVPRKGGNVQVKAVIYKAGVVGVADCSRVHKAIAPRLELEFPDRELAIEVSSPGIDRVFDDGEEAAHFIGRGVKFYVTSHSAWTGGILREASPEGAVLETAEGEKNFMWDEIGKARLASEFEKQEKNFQKEVV